jgi:glycosyltransferase involved in cell wall biosynthesis
MTKDRINVGILTVPLIKSGIPPLKNLIAVTNSCSDSITLITGNEGYDFFKNDPHLVCYGVNTKNYPDTFRKILYFVYVQITQAVLLAKASKNVDIWIFFLGEERQILPLFIAKLLRKKIIISSSGSSRQCARFSDDPYLCYIIVFSKITYCLADCLILYSKRFIEDLNLYGLKEKIFISHASYIDITKFNSKIPLCERKKIIGYLGRLSPEKGILNFIHSVPEILKNVPTAEIRIAGVGALQNQLSQYIEDRRMSDRVHFLGWVDDEELPHFLNEIQLLVIPSYTEGLPSVLLESMSCGTPVLASPVGAISEIIINEKNGFILKNNSVEEIGKEIVTIFQNSDLLEISVNARDTVLQKFSFRPIAEQYCNIIKTQLL